MAGNNLNLDLVTINAHTKFGQILSIFNRFSRYTYIFCIDCVSENHLVCLLIPYLGYLANSLHLDQPASEVADWDLHLLSSINKLVQSLKMFTIRICL